jgi:hypothetical protein
MHVKVHLETALGTGWTLLQFMPCEAENELSSAHNAPETLLSVIDMAVFIDGFRGACRTGEIVCFLSHFFNLHNMAKFY